MTLAPDGYNADPSLFGNAIVTDAGGANMPAGTYQVQLQQELTGQSECYD